MRTKSLFISLLLNNSTSRWQIDTYLRSESQWCKLQQLGNSRAAQVSRLSPDLYHLLAPPHYATVHRTGAPPYYATVHSLGLRGESESDTSNSITTLSNYYYQTRKIPTYGNIWLDLGIFYAQVVIMCLLHTRPTMGMILTQVPVMSIFSIFPRPTVKTDKWSPASEKILKQVFILLASSNPLHNPALLHELPKHS